MGNSIRAKLLQGVVDNELEKAEKANPGGKQPSRLALVLRELRRKNLEATQAKEDRL